MYPDLFLDETGNGKNNSDVIPKKLPIEKGYFVMDLESSPTNIDGILKLHGIVAMYNDDKSMKYPSLQSRVIGIYVQRYGELYIYSSTTTSLSLANADDRSHLQNETNSNSKSIKIDMQVTPNQDNSRPLYALNTDSSSIKGSMNAKKKNVDRPQSPCYLTAQMRFPTIINTTGWQNSSAKSEFNINAGPRKGIVKGVLQSQNCHFRISVSSTLRMFNPKSLKRKFLFFSTLITLTTGANIALIAKQIKAINGPALFGLISFPTIVMMGILNAYACMAFFFATYVMESMSWILSFLSILKFLLVCIQMQMLRKIWRATRENPVGLLNLQRHKILFYAYFFVPLLVGLIVLYAVPPSLYFCILVMLMSFWTPQIAFNIWKNSVQPLSSRFIVGSSVLHILEISYFMVYKSNFLDYMSSGDISIGGIYYFLVICALCASQAMILVQQKKLGPRFCVPSLCLPKPYDYFRHIVRGDIESGSSLVLVNIGPNCVCSICLSPIQALKSSMITPCGHIFHVECLTTWMQQKQTCPSCRQNIPAFNG